jgi:predicted ATPase/class 3 adenylate cyclase
MTLPSGTVTFLFTDIEGSTQLWEKYPEAMKSALARHDALLRGICKAHHGHVFKTVGDAFCVAFTNALEAVNAAIESQSALYTENWGETVIKVRMALHCGEVETRDDDYFGQPLNRVARLLSAGHGGQILLSATIKENILKNLPQNISLRDMGERRLKDLAQPEHIFQLIIPNLPNDFPPLKTLDVFRTNLPAQLSSFVGREKEIGQIKKRMEQYRLVTLTGSGGIGKTRLSIQVAADSLDEFPQGVWFVELAPLTDPALIPQALCAAIGLTPQADVNLLDALKDFLRPRKILLTVDNCEHLIDACAQLSEALLLACPDLAIIASSREALGIEGESAYRVPSLSMPDAKNGLQAIEESESGRLFVKRAAAIQPDFKLTDTNAPAVAQICQRLDGIALAIELAASRVKMLKPEQIASRLDDSFRLLTGGSRTALPRQQTLRALIDWSYNLLAEEERVIFRRLSVFMGGWTLEAAEAVCGREDMLDLLTRLADKSLVSVDYEHSEETRYYLLETIRQYAREKLNESGESQAIRQRHAEYFAGWVSGMGLELRAGPTQMKRFAKLENESPNIHAALDWLLSGGGDELALKTIGTIYHYWWRGGNWLEWRHWLNGIENRLEQVSETTRASALMALCGMEFYGNRNMELGKKYSLEAREIFNRHGMRRDEAWAMFWFTVGFYGVEEEYETAIGPFVRLLHCSRRKMISRGSRRDTTTWLSSPPWPGVKVRPRRIPTKALRLLSRSATNFANTFSTAIYRRDSKFKGTLRPQRLTLSKL